jgi:regulator of protease activity HflC (stomatin/prohibitin superfamily)
MSAPDYLHDDDDDDDQPRRFLGRWRWIPGTSFRATWLLITVIALSVLAVLGVGVWQMFFENVPSGHVLVVIAKSGDPLPEGEVLAKPGQKGIQEKVLGEGWHFVWPVLYTTEIKPNIVVPGTKWNSTSLEPGKVGIVKALGGSPLPPGEFLADKGQRGIWREILLPGSYRLNPYGYEVTLVDMVEIKQGHVGVMRRKLGVDGPTEFANRPNEKGILPDRILQPGLYPINTEEYEVIPCEVGIYQTSYHYSTNPEENTALVFDASDSNRIQLDCTIEWELKPEHWPQWLSKFRNMARIEATVIRPNVKNISRNEGQDYGAEDFLDGTMRERFQTGFTEELRKACDLDNVEIRNAFIRNIIIPDTFLQPKREEQLAKEKAITQIEQTLTAETENDVTAAQQTIALEVAKVQASTGKLVGAIERETENLTILTDATVEKLNSEYSAQIAVIEAEQKELLGEAEAEAKKLANTAQSELYKLRLGVFGSDSEALMRYTLTEKLNPDMKMRLFQSGPGTFWTNLGKQDMNLFLPVPGGTQTSPVRR